MTKPAPPESVDAYVASFPPAVQRALEELRAVIRAAAPDATERISYAIPTYELRGHYLLYLAGWKRHVGVYPITAGMTAALGEELAPYRSGRSSLRFPLAQPMPVALVRRLVAQRVAELAT